MTLRRWLKMVVLFPAMLALSVEGAGVVTAEEAAPLPETETSEIPKPDGFSDEEWAGMTDAEREAMHITAEDVDGEGVLSDEELAAIAEEDEPAGEIAEGTEAPETEVLASDEDLLAFRPTVSDSEVPLPDTVPAELQTKLDGLDTKIDELEKQFDEAEISRADMNKALREISKERSTIERQVIQHQIAERDAKKEDLVWQKEQDAFIKARPDYVATEEDGKTPTVKATALFAALDKTVQRLNTDPKNNTKTGMQILLMADQQVRTAFNMTVVTKGKETPAATATKPTSQRPTIKTLSATPTAAVNEGNPYAHINRLKGEAFEKALGEMTDKQRDAYMRSIG